jgi:hypothetical protein
VTEGAVGVGVLLGGGVEDVLVLGGVAALSELPLQAASVVASPAARTRERKDRVFTMVGRLYCPANLFPAILQLCATCQAQFQQTSREIWMVCSPGVIDKVES